MDRKEIGEFLKVQNGVMIKISEIINYPTLTTEPNLIHDGQSLTWSYDSDENLIYFDRYKTGDLHEYCGFTVSSLGAKGIDLFMGESDGLTYAMIYSEDDNWDETFIIVLDNDNKIECDEDRD